MITRNEVLWAFRYILGRDPETEAVLESHQKVESWQALRAALIQSPEYLSKNKSSSLPDVWVVAAVMNNRRMMWVNLADRHVSMGCLRDSYEPFESAVFSRMVRPGHTVLDIGANIGWYSLIASTLVGPSGKIVAFEPRPTTSTRLKATMALNKLSDIMIIKEAAVGEVVGEAILTWVKDTENPGGSHLTRNPIGTESVGVTVPVLTLDSLDLPTCDVIKIDVEGAEARVMQGAVSMLKKYKPLILSELHPDQLANVSRATAANYIGFMADLGYECYMVDALHPALKITELPEDFARDVTNVLFIPTEKAEMVNSLIPTS